MQEYEQADAALKQAFCPTTSPAEAREAVLAELATQPAAMRPLLATPGARHTISAVARWAIAASILLAVGLLGGFAAGRARPAAASPMAKAIPLQIASVQGTVLVKHTGMDHWEELRPSSSVLLGDVFHTAGKAGATLTLWGKSSIELKANTTLSADAFIGEVQFTLRSGTIKADLESAHSPFFIRTPQGRLEADESRQAVLMEVPNLKSLPNDTCRIGETSLIGDARFYDLSGNLLPHDVTKTGKDMGFYEIHFPQPVAVKGTFRMIAAGNMAPGDAKTLKEGSQRYNTNNNGTPCCLNYYQVILPKGAIYVDANLPTTSIKEADGRTAVTIRNYRGQYGNSRIIIAFLWPDKDGTSLEDLPIVDDKAFHQLVTKDMIAQLSEQFVDSMDFLGTPAWPETPEEGYIHPVYMSWPGSHLRQDTLGDAEREIDVCQARPQEHRHLCSAHGISTWSAGEVRGHA